MRLQSTTAIVATLLCTLSSAAAADQNALPVNPTFPNFQLPSPPVSVVTSKFGQPVLATSGLIMPTLTPTHSPIRPTFTAGVKESSTSVRGSATATVEVSTTPSASSAMKASTTKASTTSNDSVVPASTTSTAPSSTSSTSDSSRVVSGMMLPVYGAVAAGLYFW